MVLFPQLVVGSCPFCNSVDVTTTSKAVNVSTYWRCTACGQIWNVGRLQHGRRTSSGRLVLERTAGSELHRDEDGTLWLGTRTIHHKDATNDDERNDQTHYR